MIHRTTQDPVVPICSRPGRRQRARWICGLLALLSWALVAPANEGTVIRHLLSFPERGNQYLHVEAVWPAEDDFLELTMPAWAPGSYVIRDFAAHVEGMQARDSDGRERTVRKVAKNRWRIEAAQAAELTVSYDVWAGELNVASPWVEADGALLNGAGIFLYNEVSRGLPQEVILQLPAGWSNVETSLQRRDASAALRARDFDELVDSPIVVGTLERHAFRVRGRPYALVFPSGNTLWDAARAREDVAKIVEAHQEFWDADPFQREYLFLNFFMGPFGGLEHDHSTVMMLSLIHISEPTRPFTLSRMPSSA